MRLLEVTTEPRPFSLQLLRAAISHFSKELEEQGAGQLRSLELMQAAVLTPSLLFQGSLEGPLPTLTLLGWKCYNLISPCLGLSWPCVGKHERGRKPALICPPPLTLSRGA